MTTVINTISENNFIRAEINFDNEVEKFIVTPTSQVWHGYEGAIGVEPVDMPEEWFDAMEDAKAAGWE